MIFEPHSLLACRVKRCKATVELGANPNNSAWQASRRGWGIVGDVVLCPEHAGRVREVRPRLHAPLPGEQGLFDLPDSATVPKRRGKKKAVN